MFPKLAVLSLYPFAFVSAQRVGVNLPPAKIAGELPAERVSNPEKQGDWPSIAYAADGALYAFWIEWNDKDADRVLVRRRDEQGRWGKEIAIDDGNWDHYSPAIVARGEGAMAIWSGQSAGNYDLFTAEISSAGRVSKVQRLTTAPFSDFNARAVADSAGNVTVAWQSFRNGKSEIYARRFSRTGWGLEVRVSDGAGNHWEPALALDRGGRAWISWDSYSTGNYDVYLRWFDGSKLGAVVPVTTESSAQFHSTVAVDGQDRVWVAWDEGGENWGKDFSRVSASPGNRGLHYSRRLGVRVYNNERLQEVSADFKEALTGRMERYAELPHLALDGHGTLWMIFRHWTLAQPTEVYHFYATRLDGDRWSVPLLLGASSGQNTQFSSVSLAPDGRLAVAYSSDGRAPGVNPQTQMHALHYNVYVSQLPAGDGPPRVSFADAKLPAAGVAAHPRPRATMVSNGTRYVLLLGDAHRHTDIRGHSGVDASLLDTYRYAIDAAQLDWLGVSDHNEVVGGTWPDGLRDYQWWFTQKAVDLFSHPPAFIPVYSYEHSLARPAGHRNVLFLKRGGPLRPVDRRKPEDNLPPEMWKWMEQHALTQPGQKVVVVPHTFAETTQPIADWNWRNARFECLLEIYQGARSSYEKFGLPAAEKRGSSQLNEDGHYAVDAINKGSTYGFVSFSDHGSTHNSWAAVWAPGEDRDALFDGLYQRRTYAASDEIVIKTTADGHFPGEEFSSSRAPVIRADIAAPDTILRVDVVRDGRYIYSIRPDRKTASFSFRDSDAKAGRTYYYLRVFQRDTENPSGDPQVGWTSPWYVEIAH